MAKWKVVAKRPGFYGRLHKPGDKPFEIDEKEFAGWMERVAEKPAKPKPAKPSE